MASVTSIGPHAPVVHNAVKRRTIVRLPNTQCVSGALGTDPFYSRMLLATERAFVMLQDNGTLRDGIRMFMEGKGAGADRLQRKFGFEVVAFDSFRGTRLFLGCLPTPTDEPLIQEGIAGLAGVGPGIHRQIYTTGGLGIKVHGLKRLGPGSYMKLLAMISREHQTTGVTAIRIVDDSRNRLVALPQLAGGEVIVRASELSEYEYAVEPAIK